MRHNKVEAKTGLVLVKDLVGVDQDDRPLRREREAGLRRRIRRGAYADAVRWETLTASERYQARVMAAVRTRHRAPVVGYDSAAVMLGYPRMEAWPGVVHLIVPPASNARSKNGVMIHREQLEFDEVVEVDGILVTSPQRTLVDLARVQTLSTSVAAIDRSLNLERSTEQNRATREQLLEFHDRLRTTRGRKQASKAIMFANGLADNPGESKSRVLAFELGFPTPELQLRHINPRGGHYYTDLEWPEFHTIGEFDGLGKYFKEEYLGRKTPGEAMHEEKVREDHLRAEGNAFARWEPSDIANPERLQRILLRAGLPIVR